MAAVIKYKFQIGEIVSEKTMGWSEEAEEIAKCEACNGEYEIIEDGTSEQDTASTDEVLNALLGVNV